MRGRPFAVFRRLGAARLKRAAGRIAAWPASGGLVLAGVVAGLMTLAAGAAPPSPPPSGSLRRLADDLARGAVGLDGALLSLAFSLEGPDGKALPIPRRFESTLRGLLEARIPALAPREAAGRRAMTLTVAMSVVPPGARKVCDPQRPCGSAFLEAFAEVQEERRAFWDELVLPTAGIRTAWYARVRIDPELRSALALPYRVVAPLGLLQVPLGDGDAQDALGVATLDIDGDHDQEFALVGRELRVYRWLRGTPPLLVATHPFPAGAKPPLRLPFGAAVGLDLDGDGDDELAAWTTRHDGSPVFGWRSGGLERATWPAGAARCGRPARTGSPLSACGVPLAVWSALESPTLVTGKLGADLATLDGELAFFSLAAGAPAGGFAPPPRSVAWAAGSVHDGERWERVVASVDAGGILAVVRVDAREVRTSPGAGSALALLDLGDDGVLDVVRSANSEPRAPDALIVSALAPGGTGPLVESGRFVVPRVRALAGGDADNDGRTDVLVLSDSGLYLLSELDEPSG